MFKKCFLLLFMLILPVSAGEVEKALDKGNNVFLYLYTPSCKYCNMFSPIYNKLVRTHDGEYSFIKIDASTVYGRTLMSTYRGSYVPYVVLINKHTNKLMRVDPACLIDTPCIEAAMKKFRG